jgi:hypothetical protein
MAEYLYRGVNAKLYGELSGQLRPKEAAAFARRAKWGKALWGNSIWDESSVNGVIEHQLHQAGHPTSGVSTTPHFERARLYATHSGACSHGFVYVINRDMLAERGVAEYVVKEFVHSPSVPEDDEVILVASDHGIIPAGVILELRKIGT